MTCQGKDPWEYQAFERIRFTGAWWDSRGYPKIAEPDLHAYSLKMWVSTKKGREALERGGHSVEKWDHSMATAQEHKAPGQTILWRHFTPCRMVWVAYMMAEVCQCLELLYWWAYWPQQKGTSYDKCMQCSMDRVHYYVLCIYRRTRIGKCCIFGRWIGWNDFKGTWNVINS